MELVTNVLFWGFAVYIAFACFKSNREANEKAQAEWDALLVKKEKELTEEGYYFWRATNDIDDSNRRMYYKLAKNCQLNRRYKRG